MFAGKHFADFFFFLQLLTRVVALWSFPSSQQDL